MDITPEMVEAWRTLQEFARRIRREPLAGRLVRDAQQAIDVIDNSNWMVPVEDAGICGDQSAGLPEPPCDLDKPCPVHN